MKPIQILTIFLLVFSTSTMRGSLGEFVPGNNARGSIINITEDSIGTSPKSGSAVAADKQIYIPSIMPQDPNDPDSQWSYERSRESDNWIVFWEKEYGVEPQGVDIDNLLSIAEKSFRMYYDSLEFVEKGQSKCDQYKMIILLFSSSDWIASGSGVDERIGLLNLNAAAAGGATTIAHEVGHCFQYQAGADQHPLDAGAPLVGWRWGFGTNGTGGNGWWEQCAQWQAFKVYPEAQFNGVSGHIASAHRHFLHEDPRYENYFIQDYWTYLHGWDFVGRMWRETKFPEDPVETYKRLMGIDQDQFNDEMYRRAARFTTWDIPHLREYGRDHILGRDPNPMVLTEEEGAWIIDRSKVLENYGYNVVRLNVPETESEVSVYFEGKAGMDGYRSVNVEEAGWRYGFVALLDNGKRLYSPMRTSNYMKHTASNPKDSLRFSVPDNCDKLWFVVTGAPQRHWHHAWDDNDSNDEQWPYQVRFENTNPYGSFTFDSGETPESDTLSKQIAQIPVSGDQYPSTPVSPDWEKVCRAFKMDLSEIREQMGSSIRYCAVDPDGSFDYQSTAIAPGHWFAGNGTVTTWANSNSRIFSEFRIGNYVFNIGQYPNRCQLGEEFHIRQALVYTPEGKDPVHVIFSFTINMVAPDNMDGDSFVDAEDNCPGIYNEDQADLDGDGVGDVCDICEGSDDQMDSDLDGVPDGCDQCADADDEMDSDGDTVPNGCDICAGSDDHIDTDEDGIPDGCDICPVSEDHTDTDGDGVPDDCDQCPDFDDMLDDDDDSIPDGCDICNGYSDYLDTDEDGIPDGCDICEGYDDAVDSDSDGVPDGCDVCEGHFDTVDDDSDGVPDGCDICEGFDDKIDSDSDGIPDGCDDVGLELYETNIRISPNPVRDILHVDWSDAKLVHPSIRIYDIYGRLYLELNDAQGFDVNIETGSLSTGTYIIYLDSAELNKRIKFFKD